MARNWYYVDEHDEEVGPVDSRVIRAKVADGTITKQTLVWRDDLPDWVEAGRIRKLFERTGAKSASSFQPAETRARTTSRDDTTLRQQSDRVSRPAVDLDGAEDDWASLAEEPIADDDPFAYHDDSGQALRSFARPAPRPVERDDDEDENPYAVTTSGRHHQSRSADGGDYATALQRFGARFVDGLIFLVGYVPLIGFGVVALEDQGGGQPDVAMTLLWFAALFIYIIGFQFVFIPLQNCSEHQASWGKRLAGIVVTDTEGHRIGFGKALGRELSQGVLGCVPFLPLINVLWHFFDEQKQCLHDKMAGTLVLRGD